ncbi:hypothetical protein BJX70DRAFT_363171 [Aspergillus crustosus]
MKFYLFSLATLIANATAYLAVGNPPCKEYEVLNECASACYPTCETYRNEVNICTQQCVYGCYCKEGTYRTTSGSCVPENQC